MLFRSGHHVRGAHTAGVLGLEQVAVAGRRRLDEVGVDKSSGRTIVKVNPKYFRPAEVETLLGDATKAKEKLGWEPKISFNELVEDMCIYGQ